MCNYFIFLKRQVFSWGHSADGRLGLGEAGGKLAETYPKAIPEFQPQIIEHLEELHTESTAAKPSPAQDALLGSKYGGGGGIVGKQNDAKIRSPFSVQGTGDAVSRRLEMIDRLRALRSKIQDQASQYQTLLKTYSEELNRYTDRADLVRGAILKRIGQFHILPKGIEAKGHIVSHQPESEVDKNDTMAGEEETESKLTSNPYRCNRLERLVAR